ncbi:MAG: SRPBCC domain-containing protein [Bacteroidota bacterium]
MPRFTLSVSLPASPSDVFEAMTKGRAIRSWSGQSGRVQRKIGGAFSMFDGWVTGHVLAYEVGRRLSFTWSVTEWPEGTQASVVRCTFSGSAKRTTVKLTHAGFPTSSEAASHRKGWTTHVFDPLTTYLKGIKP